MQTTLAHRYSRLRAGAGLPANPVPFAPEVIQAVFHPVTTTHKAHLRNDEAWGTKIGDAIPTDTEIVADRNQQRIQVRRLPDTTWTKAVHLTPWNWTANRAGDTTFIRNSRLGADKQYPQNAPDFYKPPLRDSVETPEFNWHAASGEFVQVEDSVTTPNTKIAFHKGEYRRVNPATGAIARLDADERRQIDTPAFEEHLKGRVNAELTAATNGIAWQNLLVTEPNIRKIMYTADDGSKALRFDRFGRGQRGANFVAYYNWVTAALGPLSRIRAGAAYVRRSLEHWRQWLYTPEGEGVTITSIELTGSDLHEAGLGVMFVRFNKQTEGNNADYPEAGNHNLVVKPEERGLEQRLFGTDDESLAGAINTSVELAGPDQIATYRQAVHAGFGTLCERVVATRAKDLPTDQVRPITQALKESLVFVLLTGLTDLHGENVLWDDQGKPYLIDADNALKLRYMTPDQALAQSGYRAYAGQDRAAATLREVYAGSEDYETATLRALRQPQSAEQRGILLRVRQVFADSTGRAVPIKTGSWGTWLKFFITCPTEGAVGHAYVQGQPPTSKWQWCHYYASKVPAGYDHTPGLIGEVGTRTGTDGDFQAVREASEVFADLKVGQIPFYNYQYGTGNVLHNGHVIWHGQSVVERMAGLFELFPLQARA